LENSKEISKEVFSRMRSLYASMSKAEKKIADFLLSNAHKAQFLSITDLAREVGTSESTIVRFSRKLNYQGFPDFKKALFSEIFYGGSEARKLSYEQLFATDSIDDVRIKLFDLMRTTLNDTMNNLDPDSFKEATMRIAKTNRLSIFANNESGHIAHTSAQKFLLLGINISIHAEQALHKLYAELLDENSVTIVLSHSGRAENLYEALSAAQQNGSFTISVTSNPQSLLARRAELHLLTSLPVSSEKYEAGVIRISQIAVLDCLALAVSHYKRHLREQSRYE